MSVHQDFTIKDLPIARIVVGRRNRQPREADIKKLARSIKQIGLRTPITVRISGTSTTAAKTNYELLAGYSRLQAVQSLGWETIPVCIQDFASDEEAELWEIDENLMRGKLTPAERAAHLLRRKELFLIIKEESGQNVATLTGRGNKSFAQNTAEQTGQSKSSLNEHIARADALGPETLRVVAGTSLDKGTELDALAKMSPERRAPLVAAAASGARVSACEVKSKDEIIARQYAALMREWNKSGEEARQMFRETIDAPIMDERYAAQ